MSPNSSLPDRNPTPAFRLGKGRQIHGYRLISCLGNGWEGTSYLAHEELTGAVRRLKFFRTNTEEEVRQVRTIASTWNRLSQSGAVPTYHHMGIWQRHGEEEIPFVVTDYVEGIPFPTFLASKKWNDREMIAILGRIAQKLAATHALGLAIGDFEHGTNILLTQDHQPFWCDIAPGEKRKPFRGIAADAEDFFSIVDAVLSQLEPSSAAIQTLSSTNNFRDQTWRKGTFRRVAKTLCPS